MGNRQWAKLDGPNAIGEQKGKSRKQMKAFHSFRELPVYQDAFALQQAIFQISKSWPREETYALIDQIRRSSRSIGANIAEAWAKRRYEAHFTSKLTDADAELQETLHWLDTAIACDYLDQDRAMELGEMSESVGRQLGAILRDAKSFCKKHA